VVVRKVLRKEIFFKDKEEDFFDGGIKRQTTTTRVIFLSWTTLPSSVRDLYRTEGVTEW